MQVWSGVTGRRAPLAVALTGVLALTGCSTDSSSTSGTNVTATPTFNPGAGTYNTSQTVTIADATPGAVLYCTTDGTTPTTSSPQCSQPTTVYQTEFLQAIAVAPGKQPSAVGSAGYTINLNAAATPTFSPDGGSYAGAQQVTIKSATTGANIFYTLDGSAPGPNSTLYTAPVSITKSETLSAITIASGFANSGVRSASYVISNGPAAPIISPAGGGFTAAQTVSIVDATPNAAIYYTTDGSTPTTSSTLYSGTFTVGASETVSAIAVAGGVNSTVTQAIFTINLPAAATPTFSPIAGNYPTAQQVTLNDATAGSTIYYTLDGSTPTTASSKYTAPINVASSETIKAIAIAPGFGSSAVTSAAYTISVGVPAPTFNPGAGSFTSAQQVTLQDTDANASIYYTVDGSTPTSSSTKYTAPINVASSETINAIAIDGGSSSTVATAAYSINVGPGLSGKVMSGTSPVSGASVQIYAAGNTDYASAATPLATAVTTAADGTFTLSYNCPATGGDLVYLVATGGKVGNASAPNTNLTFMAALGSCNGTLPSNPVVNEVTTVASAYALAQFMSDATHVGSSSSNYELIVGFSSLPGLSNAFGTVNSLVDLTTGLARTHTPDYSNDLSGDPNVVNNSVVPQARIHALANTLNVCAADSGSCSSLFSAATSGTAPADTLQAILSIAQHPGNNPAMIQNVAAGTGPFTPTLPASAAPNDWTLAVSFSGGGTGFAPDVQLVSGAIQGSNFTDGKFLNTSMTVDAEGNIWVTGFPVTRQNIATSSNFSFSDPDHGMIAKFNNQGAGITPSSSIDGGGNVIWGGFIPFTVPVGSTITTISGTIQPSAIAVDPNGNAWVKGAPDTVSGAFSALTEITPNLTVAVQSIPLFELSNSEPFSPLSIDGGGNVWAWDGGAVLDEYFSATGTLTIGTVGFGAGPDIPLVLDSQATSVWTSNPLNGRVYLANLPVNTVTQFRTGTLQYSPLAAGASLPSGAPGNIYSCQIAGSLSVFNPSTTTGPVNTLPLSNGRGCGDQLLMDGVGHLFAITGSTGGNITAGIIDEISSTDGSLISPTGGYTGTSNAETPTINGDPNAPLTYDPFILAGPVTVHGIPSAAIDGSGNLWVLNIDTGTDASKGNVLVKFIGLAAPVVTPNSLALSFAEVGVRP